MTTTNAYGWHPEGFDPDKCSPSWRQYVIDACEFCADCDHQGEEGARLARIARRWLFRLRRPGFIPAVPSDMRLLAEVVADYRDYEETNGRENRLISEFAIYVLDSNPAITRAE